VPEKKRPPQRLTPLWVVSLFLSLTEVVAGIAVVQATGPIQVALTCFVIAFPTLVAAAFFLVLWFRPYVLYPPAEFAGGSDVTAYVNAMRNNAAIARADVAADLANVKGNVSLSVSALTGRIEILESGLTKLLDSRNDPRMILKEYQAAKVQREKQTVADLSSFEQNSRYHIAVVGLSEEGGRSAPTLVRARSVATEMASAGFKISVSFWNRHLYLAKHVRDEQADVVYLIHGGGDDFIVQRLRSILGDLAPAASVHVLTEDEAAALSNRINRDAFLSTPSLDPSSGKLQAAVVFDRGAG
jgi:hypothetical protein